MRALPDAVDTLEAALLAAGWRPLPQGGAWYAKRFIAEPSAESAPSVEVARMARRGARGRASGAGRPGQHGPHLPSYSAIPSSPLQPHPPRREGGVENRGGAAEKFSAAARVGRLPEDPWGIVSEPSDRPVARRGVLLATVGQLVLAAAVIGALLGSAFVAGDGAPAVRPAAAPPTITHGGLRLQVPSGWVRGQAATVPGFSRPLSLKHARERLVRSSSSWPRPRRLCSRPRSRRRDRPRASAARSSGSDRGSPRGATESRTRTARRPCSTPPRRPAASPP